MKTIVTLSVLVVILGIVLSFMFHINILMAIIYGFTMALFACIILGIFFLILMVISYFQD
jgi:hypothetical protein